MEMGSKYRNKPIWIDGIRFDSIREGNRWQELRLLERAGEISFTVSLRTFFLRKPGSSQDGISIPASSLSPGKPTPMRDRCAGCLYERGKNGSRKMLCHMQVVVIRAGSHLHV